MTSLCAASRKSATVGFSNMIAPYRKARGSRRTRGTPADVPISHPIQRIGRVAL
jgi:hypothetical protein